MILNKKLILALTLCFAMPLAGCGKNYPDPPKQITPDTCKEDYFDSHPDLAKALYEAAGSPQVPEGLTAGIILPTGRKITEADVAAYNMAKLILQDHNEDFDYLNKHGPEKYKKYVADCRKALEKETRDIFNTDWTKKAGL